MKRVAKSIDGVVPKKVPAKKAAPVRRANFVRQGAMDIGRPFVSVRPQVKQPPAQPEPKKHSGLGGGEIEIVKTNEGNAIIIPKLRQLLIPQALARDLVVKLPRQWSFRARLLTVVQYVALAAIAVAAGYSTGIGQWFVLAYAVYALVTRQDSRLSFGIALFVLISVPFFQVINQPGVANNMAVYVYELLVIGTVQALIELRREPTPAQ